MNIAVTAGIKLMPSAFEDGLGSWSREFGTAGSATWEGQSNAAIVTTDPDFGACLELTKLSDTTRVRYMGETPILPGSYLRVSVRIKAMAGARPSVQIGGYALDMARTHVVGLKEVSAAVALPEYGEIIEVSAIIGSGKRNGVDMVWGTQPEIGHFGFDLTGANGGTVRVEDVRIEDVTGYFLRGMLDWVDVRDYGAVGDGVTDDRSAFLLADAAANGGEILVPEGTYRIGSDLSLASPIRFKGKLTMPRNARLALRGQFDYPTYADAFGDETEGFKRALQAMFGYTDHVTLDLRGRRIDLTEPMVISELAPGLSYWANRRVICNGGINVVDSAAWNTRVVTSAGTYNVSQPTMLTGVTNVANIEVGSRLVGPGVGREVYVQSRNIGAKTLTLSQELHGGSGTNTYRFERYRYVFDFLGMEHCARINFADLDFTLNGKASCLMLPVDGQMFHMRDCYVTAPRDRGITSVGRGCQDLLVDRCQFLSNEMGMNAEDRTSIAINVNANDVKIRDNRFVRFATFMVAHGTGHLIVGNHWFQGDNASPGQRVPGLVLTNRNCMTSITGNYIDNAIIEWTNEHDANPDLNPNEYTFGGLSITGNHFTASHIFEDFVWLSVKPYGTGHYIHGLMVTGNVFRTLYNKIKRIERIDTTHADLVRWRMRNVQFTSNTFNGVNELSINPAVILHDNNTAQANWLVDCSAYFPFNGVANAVESVVKTAVPTTGGGAAFEGSPAVKLRQGTDQDKLLLEWGQAVKGSVTITARMDNPN